MFANMKKEQELFNELLERSGLTQVEFAERVGTDQPRVSRMKNGMTVPRIATLEKYAEKLGYVIDVKGRKLMTIEVIMLVSLAGHGQELSREAAIVKEKGPKIYDPIRSHAVEEWGSDHSMVVYTINKQVDAYLKWWRYYDSQDPDTDERLIMLKAMVDWKQCTKDEFCYDWPMVVYEFEKQIKAYKSY